MLLYLHFFAAGRSVKIYFVKTKTETIYSLQLSYLPSYAQYLLEHKLEEFIQIQNEIGEELQISLLQALKNLPAEEMQALAMDSNKELLTALVANKGEEYIQYSITQWINNTLPGIDKHQVIAEDLSLLFYIRKKAFLHFLPAYCSDMEKMLQIIEELDFFLTRYNVATTETYVHILQEKIAEHTHFIEKINATSPSAIYVFDVLEQKTIYTNDKFKGILGISSEEVGDISIDFINHIVHPAYQQDVREYFKKLNELPDKETSTIKYQIKEKSGNYRWVRSYDTVFKKRTDGTVQQVIGVVIDVNKEKIIADQLRRRTEQLTEAQALAHLGSWSWQIESGTISWSDEMFRIYSLEKKDTPLTYDQMMLLIHPEDQEFVHQKLATVIETTGNTTFQNRIRLADGTIKHVQMTAEARLDTNGHLVEVLGTTQDITERQELLNHLQRNESLYQQAEILANLGNWTWDISTNSVSWTDQLYRIYGLEPQSEPINIERFLSFIHPEDRAEVENLVHNGIQQDFVDRTFRIITLQGEIKTLRSISQTQRDKSGQLLNIIGTEQDITEQQNLIRELQHSENLYKQAQSLARIGNWSIDLLTNDIIWSDELYHIYELEKNTPITVSKWLELLHPDDAAEVAAYWQQCLQERANYNKIHRIITPNNTVKFLHRKGEFIFDNEGNPSKMIGTTQDITDQFRLQQEVKDKQAFIQKITDATPSIITSYNVVTDQYEFVNEGLFKLLGYEPKELLGKGAAFFIDLIHPDDVADMLQKSYDALRQANDTPQDNSVVEFTYRIRHKNGQYRWFNTYATVFDRNSQGQVERVLRISLDVTDHTHAREKIQEQELFIKQVADASPTILYLFDTITNRFTYINHEIFYVLGYTPEEILEMGADATRLLYHPEDIHLLPERQQTDKKFQHSNSMMQYECRLKSKGGEWCWMVIREVIFKRNEEGRPIQILGAALDITKRKEMERSLLQNAYQLQQSNASLEEFAYVASHDLKEPLRKISTFGDRLIHTQQDRLSEDGKTYLRKIIDASQRMQTMINDLLSISMITGDRSFQPYSLQAILDEVKQTLEYKIEKNEAIIEAHQLPEANIIPSQFRQLFQNLLSNSLKFTRNDVQPRIRIEWSYVTADEINDIQVNKAPRYLKLDLIDNGIGFEEEYAGKIFQIFQRLHGRSEYEGTGIGLAICKKIVEHHGGTIYAHGRTGEGATFTIILPAH